MSARPSKGNGVDLLIMGFTAILFYIAVEATWFVTVWSALIARGSIVLLRAA